MLSGTRKAAVGVWLGLGLAVPAVHRGGERACALGSTRVGAVIKPQEKGVDAGLGEQPGSRHPALGIWFAKSRTAGSWPDRRAILVLHCPGGCLLPSPPKHFQTLQRHQCRAYVENLAAGPQGAFSLVPDASHAPPSLAQGPQHQIFSPAKRRASENKQDM